MLSDEWIVGFTDGEGAFQVLITKRKGQKLGRSNFYAETRFTIGLIESEHEILGEIKHFFGVGRIQAINMDHVRKKGINSKDQMHFRARGVKECSVIQKFFAKHMLNTNKKKNFEIWSQVLDLIKRGRHRTISGFLKIAKLRD